MQPNLRSIQARRSLIAREMQALRAEDAELQSVEAVLERLADGSNAAPRSNGARRRGRPASTAAKTARGKPGRRTNGLLSQRDLVLDVLKSSPSPWLKISDIIAAAKKAHGIEMPARSISPLLSNMKNAGELARLGRLVALPSRAKGRKPH